MSEPEELPRPEAPIRRFDVFAEWSRLIAEEKHHLAEGQARAYGIAVAKIVAVRKLSGHPPGQVAKWKQYANKHEAHEAWWEHVGSALEFNRKVVRRMGTYFYRSVFQPAVRQAWESGRKYEAIRDSLREPWNGASGGGEDSKEGEQD